MSHFMKDPYLDTVRESPWKKNTIETNRVDGTHNITCISCHSQEYIILTPTIANIFVTLSATRHNNMLHSISNYNVLADQKAIIS